VDPAQSPPAQTPFVLYLSAKRSVDDRALNRHVLDALRGHIAPVGGAQGQAGGPLRLLELGAGNGTMAARLVEWGLIGAAEYVAVDADPAAVADAAAAVPRWAAAHGLAAEAGPAGAGERAARVRGGGVDLSLRLVHGDLFDFDPGSAGFDLVLANAFLDLVDVPSVLPRLWSWLRPGGLYWFTINYDGETILEPAVAPDLEARIFALYHRSMDERVRGGRPSGDSRSGRHLFGHLAASGAEILAAGASDAVVHAIGGRYPRDEGVFLHHIVDTIDAELCGHPELDSDGFAAWVAERHRQIDAAELAYVAHQLDFFGRAPAGSARAGG
jgi:SAM-dependent methyltransferase